MLAHTRTPLRFFKNLRRRWDRGGLLSPFRQVSCAWQRAPWRRWWGDATPLTTERERMKSGTARKGRGRDKRRVERGFWVLRWWRFGVSPRRWGRRRPWPASSRASAAPIARQGSRAGGARAGVGAWLAAAPYGRERAPWTISGTASAISASCFILRAAKKSQGRACYHPAQSCRGRGRRCCNKRQRTAAHPPSPKRALESAWEKR